MHNRFKLVQFFKSRGLDGCGNLWHISCIRISFRSEALYQDLRKYSLKLEYWEFML